MLTGYAHPQYAQVYARYGEPVLCSGPNHHYHRALYGLKREIDSEYFDLTTIYPFVTTDMHPRAQFESSFPNAVSYTALSNPLQKGFRGWVASGKDVIEPYKEHFWSVLELYDTNKLPENHRRNIRKTRQKLSVSCVVDPGEAVRLVIALYPELILKHGIKGVTAYNEEELKLLVTTPGAYLFKTLKGDDICNVALFYRQGDDIYYHLSAQTALGYAENSNFATMSWALEFFKHLGFDRVLLGGIVDGSEGSGLARFKKGFCNASGWNYIYKAINRPEIYELLSKEKSGSHFPLYRSTT